jgi:hypothetical protein
MNSLSRWATFGLLHISIVHALLVPFIALWMICVEFPEYRTAAQLFGLFPAVFFLALSAMWTELPGHFGKALILALLAPVDVGLFIWLLETDPSFYFIEIFFVDIVAMGLAFIAMSALQLKDKRGPMIAGFVLVLACLGAFGGPVWEVYREESSFWPLVLLVMTLLEAWAYMYIFANKALPFRPLGGSKRVGILDRLLPDRFEPVSWGASDAVATPVVLGGLLIWFFMPMFV